MLNEGRSIHNFILCVCENFCGTFYYGSVTVINYGFGSNFLTSSGSGSTRQTVTDPTPVPVLKHCLEAGAEPAQAQDLTAAPRFSSHLLHQRV
jgi:hypothetical protein